MSTDSFYVQQLFERLSQLKLRLQANQSAPTPLSESCDTIMNAMKHTLTLYGDQQVYAIFELTVVPKIERLLREAGELLRLQDFSKRMTRTVNKGTHREQMIALKKRGTPLPPPVNEYRPIPTPHYDAATRVLIEDALEHLKEYLKGA